MDRRRRTIKSGPGSANAAPSPASTSSSRSTSPGPIAACLRLTCPRKTSGLPNCPFPAPSTLAGSINCPSAPPCSSRRTTSFVLGTAPPANSRPCPPDLTPHFFIHHSPFRLRTSALAFPTPLPFSSSSSSFILHPSSFSLPSRLSFTLFDLQTAPTLPKQSSGAPSVAQAWCLRGGREPLGEPIGILRSPRHPFPVALLPLTHFPHLTHVTHCLIQPIISYCLKPAGLLGSQPVMLANQN